MALVRFLVATRPDLPDPSADRILRHIAEAGCSAQSARTVRAFTVEADWTDVLIQEALDTLFCDPVCDIGSLSTDLLDQALPEWKTAFEIGWLPGVTDNVGRTVSEGLATLFPHALDTPVSWSSRLVLLSGLKGDSSQTAGVLHNPLVESCRVHTPETVAHGSLAPRSPLVVLQHEPQLQTVTLPSDPAALASLSRDRVLALSVEEMQAIAAHFSDPAVLNRRKEAGLPGAPLDVELEAIAQTWSEHCKHKIFASTVAVTEPDGSTTEIHGLFRTFVRAVTEQLTPSRPDLLSMFHDNAGVVRFDENHALAVKVETHNSPSALDPYGGAMTGIVGVNRDILGTGRGARPVANIDVFCFAPPDYKGELPPRLLHPRRLLAGVHRGVRDGGNESGIPTVNGSITFHERFLGKPLVFCGTVGLLPSQLPWPDGTPGAAWDKKILPGDRIVMTGGRIGKDGIHGATFSSEALTGSSPVTAVQIGDPITQKRMVDFLLEASGRGLFRSLTDNGAGGLSSSVGEMARSAGGARLFLEMAPLKYTGLDPWEILVSEAQERMTLAVPPEHLDELLRLATRRGVEATDLGSFEDSGVLELFWHGSPAGRLELDFLHDGLPLPVIPARIPKADLPHRGPATSTRGPRGTLLALLSRWNVCSKEAWVRQYDHEVQGGSVVKPFIGVCHDGPSDAAVLRLVPESWQGLAIAHGLCPRLSDLDASAMAEAAVDEALRSLVAVGADPDRAAALDNFCWPDPVESANNPDGALRMGQLVACCRALHDTCIRYGLPLVSGKDSMKNDYHMGDVRIGVPPTLLVTALAPVPDLRRSVTSDAKAPRHRVIVAGRTDARCGGSEWHALEGFEPSAPPRLDAAASLAMYRALHGAMKQGLVASAHDVSDGGLGVALAETALGGRLGLRVDLRPLVSDALTAEEALWSESPGRLLLTVNRAHLQAFSEAMSGHDWTDIGEVVELPMMEVNLGEEILGASLVEILNAWQIPGQDLSDRGGSA